MRYVIPRFVLSIFFVNTSLLIIYFLHEMIKNNNYDGLTSKRTAIFEANLLKDVQPTGQLTSASLDIAIERFRQYFSVSCVIAQSLSNAFVSLFRGLPDNEVEKICNQKLGLPCGTRSTSEDLLRMVQFEGVMAYASDLSARSDELESTMTGFKFYELHLAGLVNAEYQMQLRLETGDELTKAGERTSGVLMNETGCALFGLGRRKLKFPIAIASFLDLQRELKAFVKFIIHKNHPDGRPNMRSRGRISWHTRPTLAFMKEFLQSKPESLQPQSDEGHESEDSPLPEYHIEDHHQWGASYDPMDFCNDDSIGTIRSEPLQKLLTREGIRLREQKAVEPEETDPVYGYDYWSGACPGSIESAKHLSDVITFLESPEVINDQVWMTTQDTIKFLSSPFVVRRVHNEIVK